MIKVTAHDGRILHFTEEFMRQAYQVDLTTGLADTEAILQFYEDVLGYPVTYKSLEIAAQLTKGEIRKQHPDLFLKKGP